jgi:hypothetical protein
MNGMLIRIASYWVHLAFTECLNFMYQHCLEQLDEMEVKKELLITQSSYQTFLKPTNMDLKHSKRLASLNDL